MTLWYDGSDVIRGLDGNDDIEGGGGTTGCAGHCERALDLGFLGGDGYLYRILQLFLQLNTK
ncbi:MAG: hypothetical protein ACR2MC_03800 [Actinomycetota bacterium]